MRYAAVGPLLSFLDKFIYERRGGDFLGLYMDIFPVPRFMY